MTLDQDKTRRGKKKLTKKMFNLVKQKEDQMCIMDKKNQNIPAIC